MDPLMSEDELMIQSTVREFADRDLKPRARESDEKEEFCWESWKGMSDLGLSGIGIDPAFGGGGGTHRQMVVAIEEVSRGDASAAVSLIAHRCLGLQTIYQFGSEEQKSRYVPLAAKGEQIMAWALTEPGSGSDAAALQTSAVRRNDSYYLNGTKVFTTNGDIADGIVVFASHDRELKHRGISAFIVDRSTSGLRINKQHGKMGMRGSTTAEISFENAKIPVENLIGVEGSGFSYAMDILDSSRIVIAAQCVGIAQAAFESAVRYAQQRQTFGRPISDHQAIQFALADMATDIFASRSMTLLAATLEDQGSPYLEEAAMAKLYASEACFRVATKAVQIHGGYGYFKESDVERYFRDARVTSIYEGTSEVQRIVIGRQVVERYRV
ncbi:acyl-CoA dehydrogenase [SAR202 cluster bacterium AD-804-J14_MRT_500m]|nr:acyl-CoA dehydrogenase [SAR202 cluster bacterium AD-804-J14_MRT_500m]